MKLIKIIGDVYPIDFKAECVPKGDYFVIREYLFDLANDYDDVGFKVDYNEENLLKYPDADHYVIVSNSEDVYEFQADDDDYIMYDIGRIEDAINILNGNYIDEFSFIQ